MPISVKKVKGIKYIYFTYYDASVRKKIETYCGRENDPEALSKAEQLEKKHLKEQKRSIDQKLDELEAHKARSRV